MPLSLIALQCTYACAKTDVPGPVQLIVSCGMHLPDLLAVFLPFECVGVDAQHAYSKHVATGLPNTGWHAWQFLHISAFWSIA